MKKRVYDPIIQALSGFADIQSEPTTKRPQMIRTIVADKTTAIFAAQAVSAALYARERTGKGQHIQLADARHHDFVSVAGRHDAVHRGRRARRRRRIRTRGPTSCSRHNDGYITCGTISDSEWKGFVKASDDPELATIRGSPRRRRGR